MKTANLTGIVESQRAAAHRLKITTKTLRAWRAMGCPGFRADGSIDLAEVDAWRLTPGNTKATKNDDGLKGKKLREEIRKLKLANDLKESRLIERAWMVERLARARGRVDQLRMKSEAEHPLLFSAANGDVAACREVVRKIWDEIVASIQTCEEDFKKGPNE